MIQAAQTQPALDEASNRATMGEVGSPLGRKSPSCPSHDGLDETPFPGRKRLFWKKEHKLLDPREESQKKR